jgi:hypothetical protein
MGLAVIIGSDFDRALCDGGKINRQWARPGEPSQRRTNQSKKGNTDNPFGPIYWHELSLGS